MAVQITIYVVQTGAIWLAKFSNETGQRLVSKIPLSRRLTRSDPFYRYPAPCRNSRTEPQLSQNGKIARDPPLRTLLGRFPRGNRRGREARGRAAAFPAGILTFLLFKKSTAHELPNEFQDDSSKRKCSVRGLVLRLRSGVSSLFGPESIRGR